MCLFSAWSKSPCSLPKKKVWLGGRTSDAFSSLRPPSEAGEVICLFPRWEHRVWIVLSPSFWRQHNRKAWTGRISGARAGDGGRCLPPLGHEVGAANITSVSQLYLRNSIAACTTHPHAQIGIAHTFIRMVWGWFHKFKWLLSLMSGRHFFYPDIKTFFVLVWRLSVGYPVFCPTACHTKCMCIIQHSLDTFCRL